MSRFEQLADDITARGVREVFGIPGSGATLSLIDALEARGVPFHLTHFEGSGALMAATVGRLSGRAGVSLSIKGPGLTNTLPGMAAAWFESFPLVHLAEAVAPEAPPWVAHKRLDHRALCSAVTKAVGSLTPEGTGFDEMASLAEREEPAPVLLELADGAAPIAPPIAAGVGPAGDLRTGLDLVRRSRKPAIIAGSLAIRQNWGGELSRLEVPVFSTAAAKGLVDETLAHAAGVYTGSGLELTPEASLLPEADVVVGLGLTARELLAVRPFASPAINVEVIATPGVEGFAFAARLPASAFEELAGALQGKAWGGARLRSALADLDAHLSQGFLPGSVFAALDRRFLGTVRLVMDTGYFCTVGEHAWPARRADWCLMSGQARYMGTGLPMAIGAALHDSTVPTVVVLGDGSVGMYPSELKIAVRHRLPLLVLLMTDNAFGSIRTRALRDGLTQSPLVMDGRSWVAGFDAFGVPGTRAETQGAVESALSAWNPESGPGFIEVPFDSDAYESMVAGIR